MSILKVGNTNTELLTIYDKCKKRKQFYQWDTKQRLVVNCSSVIPEQCFAEFVVPETKQIIPKKVYEYNGNKVCDVPDELLQKTDIFTVYFSVDDEFGDKTVYERTFDIKEREKPDDYVYTETEVESWETLRAEFNQSISELKTEILYAVGSDYNDIIAKVGVSK